MPWVTPSSVSTGDTLQASEWNQSVVLNSLMGQPVFTNEAARDAAIPSPSEGQMCYLTAPTVPAATGATTAVPTGVQTIYNGSVWVCVTSLAALSATAATTTSTSYVTTLTGDATAVSVTLVTGTTAILYMSAQFTNNVGTASTYLSFSVSGATTLAASDANGARVQVADAYTRMIGRSRVVTGLTAGTNTFTLNYRSSTGAATSSFDSRDLIVCGIA